MRSKDARIEALRKVPLFAGLSRRDLARVLELSGEVEFVRGTIIVEAGDRARDFYVLLGGRARLSVPGRRTAVLGPGDYFGEMSVLDGQPRSATIVAETHVSALRIGRSAFLNLLDNYGSIGRKILIEMSKRVRAAERSTGRH
jgi:CRP/FNR family cyclic AMP-dependent transcriptional regulator